MKIGAGAIPVFEALDVLDVSLELLQHNIPQRLLPLAVDARTTSDVSRDKKVSPLHP